MPFNPNDFAEDTDYERFTLDRLGPHRVRIADPNFIYLDEADTGGGRRRSIRVTLTPAESGGQAREELLSSLRPVGFGAAYKILDMLVEHVLRANGARGRRLNFDQKTRALSARPASLPVPLDGHPELWERLAVLYAVFQDARHAVTHRRAQVTQSGDLEIYDNNRALTDTISRTELGAFAGAVHAIAAAVIDVDADKRQTSIVAWHLNKLVSRHGLPTLPAPDPDAGRRLLISDLALLENGLVRFDVASARGIVDHQQPPSLGTSSFGRMAGFSSAAGKTSQATAGIKLTSIRPHPPAGCQSRQRSTTRVNRSWWRPMLTKCSRTRQNQTSWNVTTNPAR
jgi:hypothetical protein